MTEGMLERYADKIIDGKRIAAEYRAEIAAEVAAMERKPSLAVIIVGEDPASKVYVRNKERGCAEVGMTSLLYRLPTETTEEELLRLIGHLNAERISISADGLDIVLNNLFCSCLRVFHSHSSSPLYIPYLILSNRFIR